MQELNCELNLAIAVIITYIILSQSCWRRLKHRLEFFVSHRWRYEEAARRLVRRCRRQAQAQPKLHLLQHSSSPAVEHLSLRLLQLCALLLRGNLANYGQPQPEKVLLHKPTQPHQHHRIHRHQKRPSPANQENELKESWSAARRWKKNHQLERGSDEGDHHSKWRSKYYKNF